MRLPEEDRDGKQKALDFYKTYTPSRIGYCWLTYFPGLEITRYAYEQQGMSDDQLEASYAGHISLYQEVQALTPELEGELELNRRDMLAVMLAPQTPKWLQRFLDPDLLGRIPGVFALRQATVAGKMLLDFARGGNPYGMIYLRHSVHHGLGTGRLMNAPKARKLRWRDPVFPFNIGRLFDAPRPDPNVPLRNKRFRVLGGLRANGPPMPKRLLDDYVPAARASVAERA